jgi:polyadenylate-binding protein
MLSRAMNKRERQISNYKLYKSKVEDWKRRNLFVRNLDDSIDDSRLRSLFAEYGTVVSVKVAAKDSIYFDTSAVMQNKSSSRGFGYVCFASYAEAKTAIDKMNAKEVEGKKICVEWWLPRAEIMQRKRRMPRPKNMM